MELLRDNTTPLGVPKASQSLKRPAKSSASDSEPAWKRAMNDLKSRSANIQVPQPPKPGFSSQQSLPSVSPQSGANRVFSAPVASNSSPSNPPVASKPVVSKTIASSSQAVTSVQEARVLMAEITKTMDDNAVQVSNRIKENASIARDQLNAVAKSLLMVCQGAEQSKLKAESELAVAVKRLEKEKKEANALERRNLELVEASTKAQEELKEYRIAMTDLNAQLDKAKDYGRTLEARQKKAADDRELADRVAAKNAQLIRKAQEEQVAREEMQSHLLQQGSDYAKLEEEVRVLRERIVELKGQVQKQAGAQDAEAIGGVNLSGENSDVDLYH